MLFYRQRGGGDAHAMGNAAMVHCQQHLASPAAATATAAAVVATQYPQSLLQLPAMAQVILLARAVVMLDCAAAFSKSATMTDLHNLAFRFAKAAAVWISSSSMTRCLLGLMTVLTAVAAVVVLLSWSVVCDVQDDKGKSKCFGFVNFAETTGASKAVEELTGKEVNGKSLYAGR